MKECVEALAMKKGISKSEAQEQINDVLDIICNKCVDGDGVSFKGRFTITKSLKKGRKGCLNGNNWESKDKNILKIKVGGNLDFLMNENM